MKLTPWMLSVATFGLIGLMVAGYFVKMAFTGPVEQQRRPRTRALPMALAEIPAGTRITRAHVGNGPWKLGEELAPDTLTRVDSLIGRIARETIPAAKPITSSMFYPPGDFPDLELGPGKRAVVVGISSTTAGIIGLLKKGQYVDVSLTVDRLSAGPNTGRRDAGSSGIPEHLGDAMTATLFRGVKILGIAGGGNVTLELDEDQSRIALLAQKKGEIDLIYSNSDGTGAGGIRIESSERDRIFFQEILGLKSTVSQQEKPFKVEYYRGTDYSDAFFKEGERLRSQSPSRTEPETGPVVDLNSGSSVDSGLAEVFDAAGPRR